MDFAFTANEEQFREELRQFLSANLPSDWDTRSFLLDVDSEERLALAADIRKQLGDRHWLALAWPKEYGGLAAGHMQQAVLNEELAYHDSPGDGGQGVAWVGPAFMLFGQEEQKRLYLPRIARGEDVWATLYTEPGAGSDLASVQTTAVKDGDEYVLNGHKTWIAGTHEANLGLVAARTDPNAPKHRGISTLVLPMDAPGVEIASLETLSGERTLAEVYLHNVRIPAENLLGTEHRGWYQVATTLDYERSGVATFARGRRNVERLVRAAKEDPRLTDRAPAARYELADRWIELQVGLNIAHRIPWMQAEGISPNQEASVSKLYGAELTQRIATTGIELLGLAGQLTPGSAEAPAAGGLARHYLNAASSTIAGGTSEVQRNVIAQRGLGLPRS